MRLGLGTVFFFLGFAQFIWGQTGGTVEARSNGEAKSAALDRVYVVQGATPQRDALVRSQIQTMQASILPLRVVFVPHWKYVDNTRVFHLHVPEGYTRALFTHLPSRAVFIDANRVFDESLGYWLAHELGHLVTNSTKEKDAEKLAKEFRGVSRKL